MSLLPAACVALCALAMLSGIAISARYVPAPEHAHAALAWLTTELPSGQFIYSLHVWSTSLLIGALHLNLFKDFLLRHYRAPRQGIWLLGLLSVALGLGLGFTGSLLPWTQHAYWDAVVRLGLMDATPVIGPWLGDIARGGDHIGLLTLTGYYAKHTHVLGPLLALVLWVRLQKEAQVNPTATGRPGQTAALVAIALCCALAVGLPAVLGPVADPASVGYEARPEWWFLPLFQLRKLVSGPAEIPLLMVFMGLAAAFLVAAPWIDRDGKDEKRAMLLRVVGIIGFAGWLVLLVMGGMDRPAPWRPAPPPSEITSVSANPAQPISGSAFAS